MSKLKGKTVTNPLTLIVSSRVDIRKFAKIVYVWSKRDIITPDVSSTLRQLVHSYADSLSTEDQFGEQIAQDTFSAEAYLVSIRMMKPRLDSDGLPSGRYSGQDRSTHYRKTEQYDTEEFRTMDKVLTMKVDDDEEGIKKHLAILEEIKNGSVDKVETITNNPLENKSGVCITCKNTINEGSFKGEEYYSKIFNNTGKIKCFDCLKNEIEGD